MDAADALRMWVAEGAIDRELAGRLRESLDRHEAPRRSGRLIWILASIGAVLIGGGLLLFIAAQWDQSSPLRRLLLLFVIYLAVVGAATIADRRRLGITASGLWFLSSIAAGVNIFLVGQIFNLPLAYWQGTLLWLLATLAMGWAAPSTAQGWLAVPLGVLTLGWISTPGSAWFEQGAFLFEAGGLKAITPLLGLGMCALAVLLERSAFSWLCRPLQVFGLGLVAIPLTLSTFHPEVYAWLFGLDVGLVHVAVGVATIGLVVAAIRQDPTAPLHLGLGTIAVLLLVVLPQVDAGEDRFYDFDSVSWLARPFADSDLVFGLYNVAIVALGIAAIVVGERFDIRGLVNVGFAMVGVLLAALYVGRIAGELPTSLAVILGGLLLVGGAVFLERKRRELTDGADA